MFHLKQCADLSMYARRILKKILFSPLDSIDGISVTAQRTRFKHLSLNVKARRVLQQHFGMNNVYSDSILPAHMHGSDAMSVRTTYSYPSKKSGISIDPFRVYTKPYCNDITRMSYILHRILNLHKTELNLLKVDISCPYNHLSILMYIRTHQKKKSHMGFHHDIKKNRYGQYCQRTNTQRINTPTVIFTIGDERILKWQRRTKEKGGIWNIDTLWSLFIMHIKDGSITIVHPLDETPTEDPVSGDYVDYKHGEVNIAPNLYSIGFAFRNVDCERLHTTDNCMLPDIDVVPLEVTGMYEGVDKRLFEQEIRSAYLRTFS